MAFPSVYDVTYSYSGFSASLGNGSFPGTQLDADLAGLDQADQNILAFLQQTFTSEGVLLPTALPGADPLIAFVDVAVAEATAIATAAATTAGTSATTAASAAGTATSARDDALTAKNDAQTAATTATTQAGNAATSASTAATTIGAAIFGQCRLNRVDASTVRLDRQDGATLTVNGAAVTIPAVGPTLAVTGLTPDTTYYVYAYLNGATLTLEASATAPATHTNGQQIKTGDATRSLVGMVNPITGPAFADAQNDRRVLSYYNRRRKSLYGAFTTNRTTTSTTLAEVNAENRVRFLSWGVADESFGLNIVATNSGANLTTAALALDAIGAPLVYNAGTSQITGGVRWDGIEGGISAGLHTLLFGASVAAGTGTFGTSNEIRGQIRG